MRFLTALMGVNFRPAEVREIVKSGAIEQMPLHLERDPHNEYDANAIKVIASDTEEDHFVGFVAKEVAEEIAPLLDQGYETTRVEVVGWLATNKPQLEITLALADIGLSDDQ